MVWRFRSSERLTPPVLFVVFNRPDLARRVFDVIRQAKPERLFVAADGPRNDRPGEVDLCRETRRIVAEVDWPCDVSTCFRDTNLGCRNAVAGAISWFFEHVESGVILEDDCLPDPSFFQFCDHMLERFSDDERVMSVTGNNFQDGRERGKASYYFSFQNHIWGWATWRRAWKQFDANLDRWPGVRESGYLRRIMDSEAAEYWTRAIESVYCGDLNTWDYIWALTCWMQKGLVVTPNINLVTNVGFDSRATHTLNASSNMANRRSESMKFPLVHPTRVKRDVEADRYVDKTYLGISRKPTVLRRVGGKVANQVRPLIPRRLREELHARVSPSFREQLKQVKEQDRLRALPRYQHGVTEFLGKSFRFVDAYTFRMMKQELFEREIYRFNCQSGAPFIIDGGANIGLSVLYFKHRFPEAQITVFEPDPTIFETLSANCVEYGLQNVTLMQGALWNENGKLTFHEEGSLAGRLDTESDKGVEVPTYRLRDFLQQPVDLLKLDIEGAETTVLKDCADSLRNVERLFVEHHSFVNKPQDLHEVLAILHAAGFRIYLEAASAAQQPFVARNMICEMDVQTNIFAFRNEFRR